MIDSVVKSLSLSGDDSLVRTYEPIVRAYFGAAAIYYGVMAVTHFFTLTGLDLAELGSVAILACLTAAYAWYLVPKRPGWRKLEQVTWVVNALVLVNVLVALRIEFGEAKLIYFVMMAITFAFASVTIRQALISILVTFACLVAELRANANDQIGIYSFVGFAAALTAFTIAIFLQRAIAHAVRERQEAEEARSSAESRLAAAERIGDKLRLQSLSDSLTALPNRRAFFEVLENSRRRLSGKNRTWLILLDLDGFKAVNDNYGHLMGDQLLKQVAGRLRQHCRGEAHASRMGGDEFNIIMNTDKDAEAVEAWCTRLLARLAETYLIEDRLIMISGSMGCYLAPDEEADTRMIQKADYALLHAKRNGKNRVVVYRDEHEHDSAERFVIEQALRGADFAAEIDLLFQPQFDLAQGRVVSAEALARWNSPAIGAIGPSRFIEVAEESGLISKITFAVLTKALEQIAAWEKPVPVSINLSGHDLISDHIIDRVIEHVAKSGIDRTLLEFEVTETAMMPDVKRASANLQRLAALGHPIALDDFGTGYSNFNYLRKLPISKLKVDRSFMENLADPMSEKILHSLVGLSRTLGVHCLLEGIENELELVMAKRVGAQSVQGYLFGMPMTPGEVHARYLNGLQGGPAKGRRRA